jgi:hypothetical protein
MFTSGATFLRLDCLVLVRTFFAVFVFAGAIVEQLGDSEQRKTDTDSELEGRP